MGSPTTRAARALASAAVALVLVSPMTVRSKPVESTTLAEAAARADHVLVAEVVGDTVGSLRTGERIKARHPDDVWEEFRILRVVRGGGPGLAPGAVVRLSAKSNSCIITETGSLVRLGPDAVEFQDSSRGVSAAVTSSHPVGTKVVLFLDAERIHYGWFVSPSPLTPEVERAIGRSPARTR